MNLDKLSNKHKLDKAVKNNYTYIEILTTKIINF